MQPFSKKVALQNIQEDWVSHMVGNLFPDHKTTAAICSQLVEYVSAHSEQVGSPISFGQLCDIVSDVEADDIKKPLLMAVQYLCGDRTHVMDIAFMLKEGDKFSPVDTAAVALARGTGMLVHPVTHEIVEDYEKKVHVFFKFAPMVA